MKKITLEEIKAWMDARLAETDDAVIRDFIVTFAKTQSFNLGALDKYARLTKKTQKEFWEEQSLDGYEYKVGRLPGWDNPAANNFSSIEEAYDQGEVEGEARAEEYNTDILPGAAYDADRDAAQIKIDKKWMKTDMGKKEYARARRIADELWRRHYSDECGWGESWWAD